MDPVLPQFATPQDEPIDPSVLSDRAPTVGHLFRSRVAQSSDRTAYLYAEGEDWVEVSWAEARDRAYRLAAGLMALGIEPEQRVAIASGTRYEWALADLAVMCAGGATTTIYPTTNTDDVAYILSDSASRVVFAEDDVQVAKLRERRRELPTIVKVVTFDGTPDGDWVISLADLEGMGTGALESHPTVVDDRIDATKPDQLATIIYTSGTTGRPKGVRLLHDTWTYQGAACAAIDILHEEDLQYLWLPLAHVFGKQLLVLPLQIGFPTAIDGRIDKIVENLAVVKPTFMGAAPRIFEKAYGRITTMIRAEGGVKARLFDWAAGVGAQVAELRAEGKPATGLLARRYALADRLVLTKVRDRFGGRIRFFISGSAALNPDVARWFDAMGLRIAEGYGLTESSSAAFVNRVRAYRVGTVGWAIPGTEARIADDGEVLLRGSGIMEGYHNNPVATTDVIDVDGWFHTGDIGEIDERGFLRITDRKKDLFKTSGGKYVAPSIVESTFKGLCPYVSQFVVYGAERNFVSALVTLDAEAILPWAQSHGMGGQSYAEIVTSSQARELVQGYVDQLNSGLNRWETVKKFTILERDLTVEEGELTPSLKLRRKVVSDKFRDRLDALYD
jgi:long-chain acyl-CoA synthetase